MQNQLREAAQQAQTAIAACQTNNDILNARAQFLGKKSLVSSLYLKLKELPDAEKPAFGQMINELRQELEKLLAQRETELKEQQRQQQDASKAHDLSLPGISPSRGSLHPLTVVRREIEDIFMAMGFEIAEGPDIEDEFHNFDALNTPPDHPSRNLADTFYLENGRLLRTQTSTVQVRTMEQFAPPIRIISPGRCYRNDKPDPSHSPVFHQVEALAVDKHISMADLKDTLQNFAQLMFGTGMRSRIRPHFFPFTEPSAEMDISCVSCRGQGCRICKNSGWLELGGAGMVDPTVLKNLGIDPEIWSGFALGMGIERIAMLKYNIPDMRILFENDVRMLRQFSGESL
ncbi:MAG: phenylalanine--tRNA ligase subunit alpha [Candidatus Cloacimonadaceae bacterium]|nr:phenylalanine--tRNA ligase subunit alpha [Candidatus Cloacimonadota bacterium]MDX9949032.1 phenylalanine--tRNA ligase subunit alpha [Candidatus Syntrophosphaera sp.]NLN85785.1 phenylalanine--tRNA ligase subunit alpha [Candidatus Cloacimonadota bacterium]